MKKEYIIDIAWKLEMISVDYEMESNEYLILQNCRTLLIEKYRDMAFNQDKEKDRIAKIKEILENG